MGSPPSQQSLEGVQGNPYHLQGRKSLETLYTIRRHAPVSRWGLRAHLHRLCLRQRILRPSARSPLKCSLADSFPGMRKLACAAVDPAAQAQAVRQMQVEIVRDPPLESTSRARLIMCSSPASNGSTPGPSASS